MRKIIALLVVAILVGGCAYSISRIDVSKVESNCARECTKTYSECISGGPKVGFNTETLRACKEMYQACIQTCPAK